MHGINALKEMKKTKCFGHGLRFNMNNIVSIILLCQRDPVQALRDGSWKDIEQKMGSTEELQKVNESSHFFPNELLIISHLHIH